MPKITFSTAKLDAQVKSDLMDASQAYHDGLYKKAYDQFLAILNSGVNTPNLKLLIGFCLARLGQNRLARLYVLREVLDYPDNKTAIGFLATEFFKINGKCLGMDFNQTNRPENIPSISLVLIVKNEETTLPKCLDSFKDIVNEMIVVDTGSTDRTVEIAKSYGARVEFFPWINDFAAARNESMKYASCDWILRTDADEYIEDPEKAKLLHAVASGQAEIYICRTISTLPDKTLSTTENTRLIKNHLGIHYDFPIHETVDPSAVRLGLTQGITNIEFKHSGYDLAEEGYDKKNARNIHICEQTLDKHPDNTYVRLIKGVLMLRSDMDGALQEFEAVVKDLPDDVPASKYLGIAYVCLVNSYLKQRKNTALFNILMDMQIDFMLHLEPMQFVGALYLYKLGDWATAGKILTWAVGRTASTKLSDVLPPEEYNKEKILLELAEVSVLQKNYAKARSYYKQASAEKTKSKQKGKGTDSPEMTGVLGDQDAIIQRYENQADLSPESFRVLAKAYQEKQEWQKAYRTFIRAAAGSQILLQDYFDMATCQAQMENLLFAQALINEARLMELDSPVAASIESMIAIKENNVEKALEKSIEAFIRVPNNRVYQNTVQQIAAKLNMTPVEALKKTGLAWIDSGLVKNGLFALVAYSRFQPGDEEIKLILAKYM